MKITFDVNPSMVPRLIRVIDREVDRLEDHVRLYKDNMDHEIQSLKLAAGGIQRGFEDAMRSLDYKILMNDEEETEHGA